MSELNAAFTKQPAPNTPDFSQADTLMFDVDDCLYRIDCGLHANVKVRICDHANQTPEIRRMADAWLGEDRDFNAADLGKAFPLIVMKFYEENPLRLADYFDEVYGSDYDLIKPDPELVAAVTAAENAGMRVCFYTNGPSSLVEDRHAHFEKVLSRLGFDENFVARAVVTDQGSLNTYDLVRSVNAGFGKPTPEGLANAVRDLGLVPEKTVFFDDGPKNLAPAKEAGMKVVWTWTTNDAPSAADSALAEKLGALKVGSTAAGVRHVLAARFPAPAAAPALAPEAPVIRGF